MTKEGVGNNQKDMQTLVHEKENKESDGVDDQDENADDLCGESDYRNEPLPCGGKKILRKIVKTNGNLWNVSAFEVKNNACDSDEETCSLKFSSHVPSKRNRFTLVVSNEEINKRFSLKGGDDQSSLTMHSKNG